MGPMVENRQAAGAPTSMQTCAQQCLTSGGPHEVSEGSPNESKYLIILNHLENRKIPLYPIITLPLDIPNSSSTLHVPHRN